MNKKLKIYISPASYDGRKIFRKFFFIGLTNANAASKFAEDPEFTINAYLLPTNFANSYWNFSVISDIVI